MINKEYKSLLLKKAKGYSEDEVIEEYGLVDGELVLQKRKVATKQIPPDLSAIKILIELDEKTDNDRFKKYENMSYNELLEYYDKVLTEKYNELQEYKRGERLELTQLTLFDD